jgi:hypothetical protein
LVQALSETNRQLCEGGPANLLLLNGKAGDLACEPLYPLQWTTRSRNRAACTARQQRERAPRPPPCSRDGDPMVGWILAKSPRGLAGSGRPQGARPAARRAHRARQPRGPIRGRDGGVLIVCRDPGTQRFWERRMMGGILFERSSPGLLLSADRRESFRHGPRSEHSYLAADPECPIRL